MLVSAREPLTVTVWLETERAEAKQERDKTRESGYRRGWPAD